MNFSDIFVFEAMRKISLLLFLVSVNQVFAQTQSIFRDDFSDNSKGWALYQEAQYSSGVSNGKFAIQLKKEGLFWWIWKPCAIDPAKPFIIKTRFTLKGTSVKGFFGLTWNTQNTENNYTFAVSRTGKHGFFITKDKQYEYVQNWTPSPKKVQMETQHTLMLKSDTKNYMFYLDDVLLCSVPFLSFNYENGIGFYVENSIRAEVDEIEVFQDRGSINPIQGDDLGVVVKHNLGSNVNTVYPEKKPTISHDGKTLFFTRDEDPANVGKNKSDDIWMASVDENDVWSPAQNLGKPVNNANNNSCIGVAEDNSWIMLKGQYTAEGEYLGSGFSIARKSGNGWANPENIAVKNFYNNNQYQEACISPDGTVLMFAIERNDTYGGKDLYISKKQGDGTWSEPLNCGPQVNSFAAEIGPFIAGDGKTVYYASEGLPGYGDADIFMITRLDDSWTNWSTPVNLGPTINTAGWDAYFTTDAKGEWGYMVSTENSIGRSDIFRFKLPEKAKPKITCIVKGKIINAKTNEPMIGELTFHVLDTDSLLGTIYASPVDGQFSMILKEGFHYSIDAKYPGYLGERVSVDMSNVKESIEKELIIYLKPIEVSTTIQLNNVFFEEDKAELHYSSKAQLRWVLLFLKDNPNAVILIGGHSMSGSAPEKYNQKLSEQRAKVVYKYLIELGVPRKQLKYKGYGSTKPVYDKNDPANNGRNRCVDFTILQE